MSGCSPSGLDCSPWRASSWRSGCHGPAAQPDPIRRGDMYSLVNVATLVRDLARHPRAEEIATELLRAFALTSADLDVLESTVYDETAAAVRRSEALAADRVRPRALQVLAAARGFADDLGIDAYTAAVDVPERAT